MAAPMTDPFPAAAPEPSYATHAWLCGARGAPTGVLSLHDGRLSFTAADHVVFDEPFPGRSTVSFPWYRFGVELLLDAGGHRHRVSLVPPHGAAEPTAVGDSADGRRAARVWRTLLDA